MVRSVVSFEVGSDPDLGVRPDAFHGAFGIPVKKGLVQGTVSLSYSFVDGVDCRSEQLDDEVIDSLHDLVV